MRNLVKDIFELLPELLEYASSLPVIVVTTALYFNSAPSPCLANVPGHALTPSRADNYSNSHPNSLFVAFAMNLFRRFCLLFTLRSLLWAALVLIFVAGAACSGSRDGDNGQSGASSEPSAPPTGESSLLWEAWNLINTSYVDAIGLDSIDVAGPMILGMLDAANKSPYPFLVELADVETELPDFVPPELSDVWKAWTLHRQTWPDLDSSLVAHGAVRGLLGALDDSSVFLLDKESYAQELERLAGTYEGIGAFVQLVDDRIVLVPMQGSPALAAGLQEGDVLLEVNDAPVEGQTLQEVVDQVRGPVETRVNLLVEREGQDSPLEIQVFRGDIGVVSMSRRLLPGAIGYIHITDFRENTGEEVLTALEEFNALDTLALILDLRNNSGRSVEAALSTASQFLSGGLFMYEVDREGTQKDWLITEGGVAVEDLPMAVLVNEFTANAAEALAGSLQDAGRAEIMGVRTLGLGSDNVFMELSDGSAIYLPVSHWYTPSGTKITGTGIVPDQEVALTLEDRAAGVDSQANHAYDYLDSQLPAFR